VSGVGERLRAEGGKGERGTTNDEHFCIQPFNQTFCLLPSAFVYRIYSLRMLLRLGWRNLRSALASIWRMRSRVTLKI
jgi:hypothetical protein